MNYVLLWESVSFVGGLSLSRRVFYRRIHWYGIAHLQWSSSGYNKRGCGLMKGRGLSKSGRASPQLPEGSDGYNKKGVWLAEGAWPFKKWARLTPAP